MVDEHRPPGDPRDGHGDRPTLPLRPTAFGSPEYAEPGFPPPPGPGRGPRRAGRIGWVVAAVCLVIIGVGGGYLAVVGLGGPGGSDAAAASGTPARSVPGGGAQPDEGPVGGAGAGETGSPSPEPRNEVPKGASALGDAAAALGLPDPSSVNATLGVVASIDGDSFVVRTLSGGRDHVTTDSDTYFVTVRGTGGIDTLAKGDLVFVGGTSGPGGTIDADMVLGGVFPELGPGTG